MELLLYYRLSTRSKRAMRRRKGRYGNTYFYQPRGVLLQRLSQEFGMTESEVANQLFKERSYLLEQDKLF